MYDVTKLYVLLIRELMEMENVTRGWWGAVLRTEVRQPFAERVTLEPLPRQSKPTQCLEKECPRERERER